MIACLMFLLGVYTGITACVTYAQAFADDDPILPALWRALRWPRVVYEEIRASRAYRRHPTGDV